MACECLERWPQLREHPKSRVAVLVGWHGKTPLAIRANDRIFRDRFLRILGEELREKTDVAKALDAWIAPVPPTNAYTLSGSMPNVAAGRVCQVLDFQGPNLVVDDASPAFAETSRMARQFLAAGNCDIALVIGLENRG